MRVRNYDEIEIFTFAPMTVMYAEKNTIAYEKTVIFYGLISGIVSATLMVITALLSDRIGFEFGAVIGYAAMLVSFSFIYFGLVSYRKNTGADPVKYGKALSIGLLITAISCVCYVITWVIVYHTMFPDFMDKYAAHVIARARANGVSADEIKKQMVTIQKYKEMYKNPVMMFLLTFIEPLPMGVIVSFISPLLLKMKKNEGFIWTIGFLQKPKGF